MPFQAKFLTRSIESSYVSTPATPSKSRPQARAFPHSLGPSWRQIDRRYKSSDGSVPVLTVLDGETEVPFDSTVSFGNLGFMEFAERTFTIRNDGGRTLFLGTLALVDNDGPYEITVPPGSTTLPPGATTDFTIRFNGDDTVGEPGVTVSIPSNVVLSPFVFGLEAIVDVGMGFFQAPGPFEFPPGAYLGRYLRADITGNAKSKYAGYPNDPNAGNCEAPFEGYTAGITEIQFSGYSQLNPDTGEFDSSLQAILSGEGDWLNFSTYHPAPSAPIPLSAETIGELFSMVGAYGGNITTQYALSFDSGEQSFARQFSVNNPGGYYVVARGGVVWCPSGFQIVYSNLVKWYELEYTPTVSGEPARTQHIATYDSGTNTYTGNMSFARSSFRAVSEKASVTVLYTVTPDDGSPAYQVTRVYPYSGLTIGEIVTFDAPFPIIVGAEVYAESISVTPYDEINETFESLPRDLSRNLAPTTGWPQGFTSTMNFPNRLFWDDFQSAPTGVLTASPSGIGLVGAMTSIPGVDYENFHDDFEAYTVGTKDFLGASHGLRNPLTHQSRTYLTFAQTFEGLAAGSTDSIPVPSDLGAWRAPILSTI